MASLYTTTKTNRAPTTSDYSGYVVGETWLDTTTEKYYQLVKKENNMATWKEIGAGVPIRRV